MTIRITGMWLRIRFTKDCPMGRFRLGEIVNLPCAEAAYYVDVAKVAAQESLPDVSKCRYLSTSIGGL